MGKPVLVTGDVVPATGVAVPAESKDQKEKEGECCDRSTRERRDKKRH